LLAKLLLPGEVSGKIVDKYIRKALRTNSWRTLKPENRALLLALRKWRSIKSPTLKSILYRVFLEIELHTLRGKALLYGIIPAMKNYMHRLEEILRDTAKLLVIGISYLSNPPIYTEPMARYWRRRLRLGMLAVDVAIVASQRRSFQSYISGIRMSSFYFSVVYPS